MEKDLFSVKKKKESFLKQQNWFLGAILVLVIYGTMLILVYGYLPETDYIEIVVHILPVIVVFMLILGWLDKKSRESSERERKTKRYQARMVLSRLKGRSGIKDSS